MSDFFIDSKPDKSMARPSSPVKTSRRKTKKEMSNEEYQRVCERMAELRNKRKTSVTSEKSDKPVKVKEVIKYVDRPVEIVKEVIKEIEKPVEKIVEKIVEVEKPAKHKYDLFGDTEDLKKELNEVKSMLHEMRKPKEEPKPAVVAAPKPEEPIKRMIYTGPRGMFRPY
jgi:hypothetical protein